MKKSSASMDYRCFVYVFVLFWGVNSRNMREISQLPETFIFIKYCNFYEVEETYQKKEEKPKMIKAIVLCIL